MNDWCPKCGTYHEQTTAGTCPENLEDKLFLGTYAEGHDAGYRAGVEASKAERDKLRRLLREAREALRHASRDLHYEPSLLARGGTTKLVDMMLPRIDAALEEKP